MNNNNDDNTIEIWTDGGCSGNPGPGGWGAIIKWKNNIKEISGSEKQTTNNRMELIAAINALKAVKKKPMNIILTTDSKYVKDGITTWIHNWKIKNWKNVKNIDLWKMLDEQQQIHNIQWEWIKGHSGHVQNERCDSMARTEIKLLLKSELD